MIEDGDETKGYLGETIQWYTGIDRCLATRRDDGAHDVGDIVWNIVQHCFRENCSSERRQICRIRQRSELNGKGLFDRFCSFIDLKKIFESVMMVLYKYTF